MARLSDETITRIKQEVSLTRLLETQGHNLKKHGQQYAIRCPWHEDNTPSLILSPDTNLWHCKGCNEGGDNIKWVMKTQGVSFRFACEILMKDLGVLENTGGKTLKQNSVTKLSPLAADADNQSALKQVIDYYHATLKQAPEAQDYLRSRGLDNRELIDTFKIGFANRTLGYRLPEKNRKAGAELRGQLQAIGILRQSGHEHFNGCLVVPVMDGNGVITEVYGRRIQPVLPRDTPPHLYLPGAHEGVWNIAALKACKEIILCESLIDAMSFWVHGFKNVTASYGTGGFTPAHLEAFRQHKTERVLIAYDRDQAGDRAAVPLAEKLQAEGIECFRLLFPKNMDANEYSLKMSPPQKALALVIRNAEWIPKARPSVAGQASGAGRAPNISTTAGEHDKPAAADRPSPLAAPTARETEPDSVAEVAPKEGTPEQEAHVDQQATPLPALPSSGVAIRHGDHELFIEQGERLYRIRGLDKNSGERMNIQMLVKQEEAFHMDRLDLYSSKQRQVFVNQASVELGVKDDLLKKELGKILLALEEEQARQKEADSADKKQGVEPDAIERRAALELLQDPALLERILSDFRRAGVVGEESNKLAGYLSCVSRRLDKPLAVVIQSSSAAGKSSLMESILALMPEEERIQYSAMTGQSLFYMGEQNLKHKILAIAEEEGASNASYALKLLQSEGEVRIASTGKDEASGNLVTREYRVEGPVMLFMTTTAIDIDEELMNRCLVLAVDESREQTRAIHAAQRARRTLKGLQDKVERERILTLHRHAQRLLKPLTVINPWADYLTFLDDKTRTRRDHEKYLTLIDSLALLHQHQRPLHSRECADGQRIDYVEVSLDDIDTANRLAHEILGRTLDELPPQTRNLLGHIQAMVRDECERRKIEQVDVRFSRKSIRDATGWSDGQLKIHCKRLEELEYLLVHRGGRGQSMEYELLYDGDIHSAQRQLMGLLDVARLREKQGYDGQKSGLKDHKSGAGQGQVRPMSGQGKTPQAKSAVASGQSGQGHRKNALQAV